MHLYISSREPIFLSCFPPSGFHAYSGTVFFAFSINFLIRSAAGPIKHIFMCLCVCVYIQSVFFKRLNHPTSAVKSSFFIDWLNGSCMYVHKEANITTATTRKRSRSLNVKKGKLKEGRLKNLIAQIKYHFVNHSYTEKFYRPLSQIIITIFYLIPFLFSYCLGRNLWRKTTTKVMPIFQYCRFKEGNEKYETGVEKAYNRWNSVNAYKSPRMSTYMYD